MGKYKKVKKPFQGMEHLIDNHEYFSKVDESPSIVPNVQKKTENIDFNADPQSKFNENSQVILKKELVSVVVLMSVLFLVLVGLMVYDINYDGLSVIAGKITEFLGK